MEYFDYSNPDRIEVLDGEIVGWVLTAKQPFKTWSVNVAFPVDAPPKELFSKLKSIGFVPDNEFTPMPPLMGIQEAVLYKDGSAIFGEWDDVENKKNIRQLNKLFKDIGFAPPAKYKLTLADLL